MLPSGEETQATQGRRKAAVTYITIDDLNSSPKEVNIIAVRTDTENKFGPRIILKVQMEGRNRFYGVNVKKNPNYSLLLEKFGREEQNWEGKKFFLSTEQDKFTENYNIRVSFKK